MENSCTNPTLIGAPGVMSVRVRIKMPGPKTASGVAMAVLLQRDGRRLTTRARRFCCSRYHDLHGHCEHSLPRGVDVGRHPNTLAFDPAMRNQPAERHGVLRVWHECRVDRVV